MLMTLENPRAPILVTGAHRSGSTWVGRILSRAPGVGYLHEPFNASPMYPQPRDAPMTYWYLYLDDQAPAAYHHHFEQLLRWRYRLGARLLAIQGRRQLLMGLKYSWLCRRQRGRRMCMKDPLALFSAEWLVAHFGVLPVVMIRHPGAFVYSLLRKSWRPPWADLLAQERLMKRFFEADRAAMEACRQGAWSMTAQAALMWTLLYKVVRVFQDEHPHWYFLKHETLSLDPERQCQKLFEHLGLPYTETVASYVRRSAAVDNPGATQSDEELFQRNARANATYWQQKLPPEDIALIRKVSGGVWPDFYADTSWPH